MCGKAYEAKQFSVEILTNLNKHFKKMEKNRVILNFEAVNNLVSGTVDFLNELSNIDLKTIKQRKAV